VSASSDGAADGRGRCREGDARASHATDRGGGRRGVGAALHATAALAQRPVGCRPPAGGPRRAAAPTRAAVGEVVDAAARCGCCRRGRCRRHRCGLGRSPPSARVVGNRGAAPPHAARPRVSPRQWRCGWRRAGGDTRWLGAGCAWPPDALVRSGRLQGSGRWHARHDPAPPPPRSAAPSRSAGVGV